MLLALHVAAIESLVHLPIARERFAERLLQLRLLAPTPPAPAPAARPAAAPPRPRVAPPPPVELDAPPRERATAPIAAGGDGAASTPALHLDIPRDFRIPAPAGAAPLTPAQEAMRDPRSNRLVLTKQEGLDLAFGGVQCIAWQREPDGSIYRGPGHLRRVQGISTNPFTRHKPGEEDRPLECVK